MDLELQRDNIQHEIKELRSYLGRQKQESQQVVQVEKKNELKVLELSIEKDQLQSEVESLKSQLKQAEGNFANEKQNYLHKVGILHEQLHEEQKASKEAVEKLKQVSEVFNPLNANIKIYVLVCFPDTFPKDVVRKNFFASLHWFLHSAVPIYEIHVFIISLSMLFLFL